MAQNDTSSQPIPGTIFTTRQLRILKWAVLIMGIILVVGFVIVIAGIIYQASRLNESTPVSSRLSASAPARALAIPEGSRISHIALGDNRLAVHVEGPQGAEIRVIDLGTGSLVTRIPVTRE